MTDEIDKLKIQVVELTKKNIELEAKLKTYTNPERNKKYYEKHSDIAREKSKQYVEKLKETNPDKLKEWRHTAYLKRKAKLQAQKAEEEVK